MSDSIEKGRIQARGIKRAEELIPGAMMLRAGRSRRRRKQGFPVGSGQTWFLGDKAGQIQSACTRRKRRCCPFRLPVPWPDEKRGTVPKISPRKKQMEKAECFSKRKASRLATPRKPIPYPRKTGTEPEDGFSDRRPDQLRIP